MPDKPTYAELEEQIRNLQKMREVQSPPIPHRAKDNLKYENIFEDAPIGIATVEEEGRITSANPFLCEFLGYRKEELLGMKLPDIAHPDDYQKVSDRVQARLERGEPLSGIRIEKRFRRKDGEYVWAELVTSSIEYQNGNLSFGMGMIVDLTKRKRAEQALKLSEKRYRSIYSQSPIGIELFDQNGILVDANHACLEIFGLSSPDDVKGFNLFADPNMPPNQKKKLLEGEMVRFQIYFDFEVVKSHGLYPTSKSGAIWLDVFITPTGPPNYEYLGQIQDITERTLAEFKLQESEARWKFALEGAGDGVWDWNVQTNEVIFSGQWKAMLGFDEAEIGTSLKEWESRVHPDDLEKTYADVNAHLRGETPVYQSEHRVLCKDGAYKWILDRGKVIERDENGGPLRVIGTHSDISDRKKWEMEREKLIKELRQTLEQVKTLSGLLPICSFCKKIRNDEGSWDKLELYIQKHSDAKFSHGVCRDCAKKYYPDLHLYND